MGPRIGTRLHEVPQLLLLLVRQFRWAAGRLAVEKTVRTLLVEAMHPIAQRLAIHAADARRGLAIHAVANRRQRKQPPRLIGILGFACQNPQTIGIIVVPNRNRRAHRHLPNQSVQGQMNHTKPVLAINESQAFRSLVLVIRADPRRMDS